MQPARRRTIARVVTVLTVLAMTRAEVVPWPALNVTFTFCTYDCARDWCSATGCSDALILEQCVAADWCIACSECGGIFHVAAAVGEPSCALCGPRDPCPATRWLMARKASEFAGRWRQLSNAERNAYTAIADHVWEDAYAITRGLPRASGADVADILWAAGQDSATTPFG